MEKPIFFISVIITVLITLYIIIKGIVFMNNFFLSETNKNTPPTPTGTIYFRILFSIVFIVLIRELINIYIKKPNHYYILLLISYTLAVAATAYVLNKLFNKKNNSLQNFELNTDVNPNAENDFKKICQFFIDKHQLFDYSITELTDLINPNSKGLVFNVTKSKNNKHNFFLFLRVCKDKCFKNTNTEVVAKSRFKFDEKYLSNIKSNQNYYDNKTTQKDWRKLMDNLKLYHVKWEYKK